MSAVDPAAIAAEVLYREGRYLDRQEWDAWLALYHPDVIFWVPAWKSEHAMTETPDTEVSFIYHEGRRWLEERVMRIGTRKSVTALPLPRTVHHAGNVLVLEADERRIEASASWAVDVYEPRTARERRYFGRYELTLRRDAGGAFLIARKHVLLVNDRIPTTLDFYTI
jgi:benzoate/toluate 1,2-dioxygenase beta subunit/2,4,5-trichlorophenoxyacetic acid oxygenase 2